MGRYILSLLVAISAACNAGAQTCVQADEQQGFNLVALKSTLMVGALSCAQQDQYNRFMTRFAPTVLAGQHAMDRYFGQAYGLYAQIREDSYVTQLANNQSEASIDMGTGYCAANAALFSTVLALKTAGELQLFTAANPPVQPIAFTPCPAALPSGPTVTAAAAARALAVSPPPPPQHPHMRLAGAKHTAHKPNTPPAQEALASVSI